MSAEPPLKVVLCWHMHQPEYRDTSTGRYQLPWTYLHAIKDYVDMAAALERNPQACAVVNFVPILLDQITDYANRIRGFLTTDKPIGDHLLDALCAPSFPDSAGERLALLKACLRANEQRLINRFSPYRHLADIALEAMDDPAALSYLSDQFLSDILVWYHLAWMGETVRREHGTTQNLVDKGCLFTLEDRRLLLKVIGDLLGSILNRYLSLAARGQVELSMSPYAHPMAPLLLDFKSATEAYCEMGLPEADHYPGGEERVHWHIREGIAAFQRHFGFQPRGLWPAEGGVSGRFCRMLDDYDFTWIASGETVVRNSLAHERGLWDRPIEEMLHRVYRVENIGPACFFRDDGLSDLIGFTYSGWHADDAVNNLVHHLENIVDECTGDRNDRVVSIIMDGENAWESYPDNGYHFLGALHKRLAEHPRLHMTTFSGCLQDGVEICSLPKMVAGSWVYGTFSTWIGDEDKNRAWDLLCEAKRACDMALAQGGMTEEHRQAVEKQLAICEGSDWFWWFGDYNPEESVCDFERLFRLHLSHLYRLIGQEPPQDLTQVISHGGGHPEQGGVMRPGRAQAS